MWSTLVATDPKSRFTQPNHVSIACDPRVMDRPDQIGEGMSARKRYEIGDST